MLQIAQPFLTGESRQRGINRYSRCQRRLTIEHPYKTVTGARHDANHRRLQRSPPRTALTRPAADGWAERENDRKGDNSTNNTENDASGSGSETLAAKSRITHAMRHRYQDTNRNEAPPRAQRANSLPNQSLPRTVFACHAHRGHRLSAPSSSLTCVCVRT